MRAPCLAIVSLVLAACAGDPAGTAVVFVDLSITRLPLDHDFGQDAALGDVDGDGDLDLVVPVFKAQNRLLINDGRAFFGDETASRLPPDADASVHAVLADLDGDGDLDLAIANEGRNRLYRNDGAGNFVEVALPAGSRLSESVAVGDVDGDGDLDLVFGNLGIGTGGEPNTLLLNDGSGSFSDVTAAALPGLSDPTYQALLADVDGDGDLDLFAANNAGQNRLLLNDGAGAFTDATAQNLPIDADTCTAAAFGDVDADGDLDLLTLSFETTPNRLLLNDGTGRFFEAAPGALPPDADLANYDGDFGDLDGDGDLDLVVGGVYTRLYLNDGAGAFTPSAGGMPLDWMFATYDLDLGDLDGDTDLDLFVTNNGDDPDRLYCNGAPAPVGTHVFHILANHGSKEGGTPVTITGQGLDGVTAVTLGGAPLTGLAVASPRMLTGTTTVAAPGIVDLTLTGPGGTFTVPAVFEYEEAATGTLFKDATARMPAVSGTSNDVLTGDVDRDGDADLVFIAAAGPHLLYLYDPATRSFTNATGANFPASNTAANNTGQAGVLVDLDGDLDLDLVIANDGFVTPAQPGLPNRLYRNDGSGTFFDDTAAALPADDAHSNGVAAADFNGDGYLDLAFANDGANLLYLNGGAAAPGTFTDVSATRIPMTAVFSRCVAALDADGDGDLDLVFGNKDARNQLWLNDGNAFFSDATAGRLPDEIAGGGRNDTGAITLLDVDGDGDLDLLLARNFVDASLLYRNDGTGVFAEDAAFQDPDPGKRLYGATAVVVGDFDADTRNDLVFTFWIMTPTIRVLRGTAPGAFAIDEALVATGASQLGAAAALDFDGDGDLDLVVAASGPDLLFENTTVP